MASVGGEVAGDDRDNLGIVAARRCQQSTGPTGPLATLARSPCHWLSTPLHVIATAGSDDFSYVRTLGADRVVDYKNEQFEDSVTEVDVVVDTVAGDRRLRSLRVSKPGGILVSAVSPVPEAAQERYGVRAAYFYADVTTARLNKITELFDSEKLVTDIGTVLPLEEARVAHEMLGGRRISAARSC